MNESLLRITYLGLGIYTFASALLTTTTMLSRQGGAAVELFSMGSLWVSFIALVAMVAWASKAQTGNPKRPLPESFLRVSFLAIGLIFFTCALATTLVMTQATFSATNIVAICGLWSGFLVYGAVVMLSQRSAGRVSPTDAAEAGNLAVPA